MPISKLHKEESKSNLIFCSLHPTWQLKLQEISAEIPFESLCIHNSMVTDHLGNSFAYLYRFILL